jgi:phosphoglycerate dehydrogenase-like enzyme
MLQQQRETLLLNAFRMMGPDDQGLLIELAQSYAEEALAARPRLRLISSVGGGGDRLFSPTVQSRSLHDHFSVPGACIFVKRD